MIEETFKIILNVFLYLNSKGTTTLLTNEKRKDRLFYFYLNVLPF